MKDKNFAQEAILKRIEEKEKFETEFQDCFNNNKTIIIEAYNELHGDYSEYC